MMTSYALVLDTERLPLFELGIYYIKRAHYNLDFLYAFLM